MNLCGYSACLTGTNAFLCRLCGYSLNRCSLHICKNTLCFAGHYVVMCGYNADTDSFILQDPAAGCCNITVTSAIFENARKAYGTDEDLLIVPLAERQVASTDIHKVQVYGKTTLCERCCCKTSTLISEV